MNEIAEKSKALNDIMSFESHLKELPQIPEKLRHFTEVEGVYMRELFIPAGTGLTGKVHTTESYSIVTKGRIAVVSDSGERMIMQAGDVAYSKPGSKKAGYAIDDTLFLTVHRCDFKDLLEIESYLAVDTMDEYQKRLEQ